MIYYRYYHYAYNKSLERAYRKKAARRTLDEVAPASSTGTALPATF